LQNYVNYQISLAILFHFWCSTAFLLKVHSFICCLTLPCAFSAQPQPFSFPLYCR